LLEYISLLFLVYFILFIGFYRKDYGIVCIDGFFIVILGIYAFSVPFGINNLGTCIGLIHLGMGFYVIIRSSIEILKKV